LQRAGDQRCCRENKDFPAGQAASRQGAVSRAKHAGVALLLQPVVGGTGAGRDQQRAEHRAQQRPGLRLTPGGHKTGGEDDDQFHDCNARLGELDIVEHAAEANRAGG
jgi:hypothetical protein